MNRRVAATAVAPKSVASGAPPPRPAARARPGLRAWREQHAESLHASLARLAARPAATALTLLVMSLALTLPLLLWLLLDNARELGGHLEDARAASVFLKPQVDAAAAQVLADRLRRRADVAAVAIKTPEQGLAEFRNQSGFAEALKLLQSNPLPTVLIVTPKLAADATTAPPPLVAELEHESGVDQVQYDALWRQRLDAILAFTARAAAVLAILLGLAAVLVVGNSVRTDIATRSEEIAVMQLLGANNAFVRRPFLYAGLVYGACAGMAALAIVIAVQIALAGPLGQLAASYGERFAVHGLGVGGALVVLGIGVLLGWIGAWLATARHLARGQIS